MVMVQVERMIRLLPRVILLIAATSLSHSRFSRTAATNDAADYASSLLRSRIVNDIAESICLVATDPVDRNPLYQQFCKVDGFDACGELTESGISYTD